MKRALGLVVLVFLLAWARVAFAEGHTSATDPLFGLAPLRLPEPSRVILWDDEPPKSNPRGNPPSRGAVAIPATR